MANSSSDLIEIDVLVSRAAGGDSQALTDLMGRYTNRLKRMVQLRMDHRLQGRIGASDIVQEALIEAARRLTEYHRDPPMGFFLWLRGVGTAAAVQ